MAPDSTLTVCKLTLEGVVPSDTPGQNPHLRLRAAAAEHLGSSLAADLSALDTESEELVLIRKLEVDLALDDRLPAKEIASAWATRTKKSLRAELSRQATSNVIVFPDRIEYLARFLTDCVRDAAKSRWYYRSFDGLWALPTSAAIRTALSSNAEVAISTLARLTPPELTELCGALTASDARILLSQFGDDPSQELAAGELGAYLGAVESSSHLADSLTGNLNAHTLALASLASRNLTAPTTLPCRCARQHAVLLRLVAESAAPGPTIADALASNAEIVSHTHSGDRARADWARLQMLALDVRDQLATAVTRGVAIHDQGEPHRRTSRFGNALLLWPQLTTTAWWRSCADWPRFGETPAENVVSLLVLCLCQGASRFSQAWNDVLLRDLCAVPPSLPIAEATAWMSELADLGRIVDLSRCFEEELSKDGYTAEVRFESDYGSWSATVEDSKGIWTRLNHRERGIDEFPADDGDLHTADIDYLWSEEKYGFDYNTSIWLTMAAQHTLKSFAHRLPGFSKSSLTYISRNLLSMSVTLSEENGRSIAYLSRVPLAVALNMAGLCRGTTELPTLSASPIFLAEAS